MLLGFLNAHWECQNYCSFFIVMNPLRQYCKRTAPQKLLKTEFNGD